MNPQTGTAVCLAGVLAVGGLGALVSRNGEVIRRWRTWLVAAPLVTGCLWLGAPGAVLLAGGLGIVGAVEYGRLAGLRAADSALAGVAAVVLPLAAWQLPGQLGRVLAGHCSRRRWCQCSAATRWRGRGGPRPACSASRGSAP
jgi:phosphatidate cytidylyltransferase